MSRPIKAFAIKTLAITVAMLALAPAITLFGIATASAQEAVQKELIVQYGDLDLSKEAGVRTLMTRLDRASDKVCGVRPMSDAYGQVGAYKACHDTAIADAVRRIGVAVTVASSR